MTFRGGYLRIPVLSLLILSYGLGCTHSSKEQHQNIEQDWPRIKLEMRVLTMRSDVIEEFGLQKTELGLPPDAFNEGQAPFCLTLGDIEANLLITASLASRKGNSFTIPSPLMIPGQDWSTAVLYELDTIYEYNPLESLPTDFQTSDGRSRSGGIGLDVRADLIESSDAAPMMHITIVGSERPALIGLDELDWVHEESYSNANRLELYPSPPFRIQTRLADRANLLAAMPLSVVSGVEEDDRWLALLIRPTIVRSQADEERLFPGLEDDDFSPFNTKE